MKFTRRAAINSMVSAGLLAVNAPALAAPAIIQRRRTFVLVHGSWHGGWCWDMVARTLRNAGHEVFTPTMTGCGERYHLIAPDTGLHTHTQDVANTIEWEELENIVLVGHGFAGTTITGVADVMADRIGHIVFFDALVPTESRPAAMMPDPETGQYSDRWRDKQKAFIDGYKMLFWDHYPVEMLVPKDDAKNVEILRRRLTWHPKRQWTDKLDLKNGGWASLPRTYLYPAAQIYAPTSEAMIGPARGPDWNFIDLDVARNGFLTDPERTAQCLLTLV